MSLPLLSFLTAMLRRVCGKDEGLWLEYLRMELVYAQKLRARQKVLGIESTGM